MGLLNSFKGWLGETAGSLAQRMRLDASIYHALNTGYTAYIKSRTEVVFSDSEVLQIKQAIQTGRLPATWATRRQHIDSVKGRHDDHHWGKN